MFLAPRTLGTLPTLAYHHALSTMGVCGPGGEDQAARQPGSHKPNPFGPSLPFFSPFFSRLSERAWGQLLSSLNIGQPALDVKKPLLLAGFQRSGGWQLVYVAPPSLRDQILQSKSQLQPKAPVSHVLSPLFPSVLRLSS